MKRHTTATTEPTDLLGEKVCLLRRGGWGCEDVEEGWVGCVKMLRRGGWGCEGVEEGWVGV